MAANIVAKQINDTFDKQKYEGAARIYLTTTYTSARNVLTAQPRKNQTQKARGEYSIASSSTI